MKINNIFLFVLLVGSVLISCSKEDDGCNATWTEVGISSCSNNYFFDTGSLWVYKDTSSLLIDSTYVTNWDHNWRSGKSHPGCADGSSLESLTISYNSSLRGNYWEEFGVGSGSVNRRSYCSDLTVDSLVVNGNVYYSVLKESRTDLTFFYKESIGILRRVEYLSNDTNVFDLQSYNVSFFTKP